MANRLVELAIEALEARKAAIDEEIRRLRSGRRTRTAAIGGPNRASARKSVAKPRRRRRSAAERKAQSLRMKEYWARKRAASGEQAGARRRNR